MSTPTLFVPGHQRNPVISVPGNIDWKILGKRVKERLRRSPDGVMVSVIGGDSSWKCLLSLADVMNEENLSVCLDRVVVIPKKVSPSRIEKHQPVIIKGKEDSAHVYLFSANKRVSDGKYEFYRIREDKQDNVDYFHLSEIRTLIVAVVASVTRGEKRSLVIPS